MSEEDLRDPRVVPRWLEAGISGVPRSREWDLVTVVELPELAGSEVSELGFTVLAGGGVSGLAGAPSASPALARLADVVRRELEPPCEVRAVRRGVQDWSVGARRLRLELVELPALGPVEELAVAVSPDGTRSVLVDGELAPVEEEAVERAAAELERRGRARHAAFVARAVRSEAGWELTIDPL